MEELAHRIDPHCWKPLGRRLYFVQAELTAFDIESRQCREKAYKMLLFWKQREGYQGASYQALFDALSHELVGLRYLAEEICCD